MSNDVVSTVLWTLVAAWVLGTLTVLGDAWESGLIKDRHHAVAWLVVAACWPVWEAGRLVDRVRGRRPDPPP